MGDLYDYQDLYIDESDSHNLYLFNFFGQVQGIV